MGDGSGLIAGPVTFLGGRRDFWAGAPRFFVTILQFLPRDPVRLPYLLLSRRYGVSPSASNPKPPQRRPLFYGHPVWPSKTSSTSYRVRTTPRGRHQIDCHEGFLTSQYVMSSIAIVLRRAP